MQPSQAARKIDKIVLDKLRARGKYASVVDPTVVNILNLPCAFLEACRRPLGFPIDHWKCGKREEVHFYF